MKSTIVTKNNTYIKFPCLMRYNKGNKDFVVLFTENKIGTVVYKEPTCEWELGLYSNRWVMEYFEPFVGEIILSN